MKMDCIRTTAAGLAVTLALCSPLVAQTATETDNDRLDNAWSDIIEGEGQLLSPTQYAALNNLAFQAAAARVCDGEKLDSEAFGKAVADILVDTETELTDNEHMQRNAAVLISFGTRYGLFVAEANGDNEKDFCAVATKLKAEPGKVPLFLK
ncbi:hypothetical protein [Ancylobacter sp.]|uniref:hypothetical protein n=1 Tax=Ancylobacter sp. TaxID=1872567 RepID=UPI003D0F2DD9